MRTDIANNSSPAAPTSNRRASAELLTELFEVLHLGIAKLHAELRKCLAVEANLFESPPPQAHLRRTQQLEKAHELFRHAEAKIELLVAHFGGSLWIL